MAPVPSRASALLERAAEWVVLAAGVFFAAVALWESFGALPGGHFAGMGGFAIAGENMLRWHIFAVVAGYVATPPTPYEYYCHHPYGVPILAALAHAVLGHHWFTTRAPAVVCSALSVPLLYALGRALWGIIPAAIAVLTFVFIPVDLAFANYTNLEVPTIFFGLLFSWATVRLWQTWRTRYLALAGLAALGLCQCDWVGLVLAGVVGAFGFLRAYVFPRRWYGRIDESKYARWFAYTTAAAVFTIGLYLYLFTKSEHLSDLLMSYHQRSTGSEQTWSQVLTPRRRMWFGWMVTRLGISIVGIGLPISVLRLVRRSAGEIMPIAWTLAATFQYAVFKQAADVHIFWPHYFGPSAALAAGAIVRTAMGARQRLLLKLHGLSHRVLSTATAVIIGAAVFGPLALLARMAFPQLRQSRITCGRFDDGGRHIEREADAAQFADWAAAGLPPSELVGYSSSIGYAYHVQYGAHHAGAQLGSDMSGGTGPVRIGLLDTRQTSPHDLELIAHKYGVTAVGPFWRVDRSTGSSFTAMRYTERSPNVLEWFFLSGSDLARTIGPDQDQWATWEWTDHLGVDGSPPSAAPGTVEELRIAHNLAVSRGDAGRASALRERVLSKIEGSVNVDFTDDVHLIGVHVDRGSATVVTMYWETGPAFKPVDSNFLVKCNVVSPPRLWFADTDFFEKDMNPTNPIRPAMWKPGYLYLQRFVAMHRIGEERCYGVFSSPETRPTNGAPTVALFTLR